MTVSTELAARLYRLMWEVRAFEVIAADRYRQGDLPGFIHLSLGQEACAVGACAALGQGDLITSTHRGHGHCLAKGADPGLMMAELFAKSAGYGKGRGGSMHIADVSMGVLGANGIVGQSLGLGVGAALSLQIRRQPHCVVAFFGEGASGTGIAHEAMNMAAIWKLPIVFFCEANRYAELSPYAVHVSVERIADRAAAYGFPGVTVDGEDVLAVHAAVTDAAARARACGGPTLIEARTYRWHGHYEGDPQVYKTQAERDTGTDFDPILRFERQGAGGLPADALAGLRAEAEARIRDAAEWAAGLQSPPASAIGEDVYAGE
ncbi:thiamine pyrophosphate-dependent dehydrogenase E1 component subunit alpha [Azospirillum canadense]|uniref:thiamine pyrophosphate-dependent dehydrogenase E1 component subunit alpha n=1 Tax=Azospirillum canadense TaxID=403962 RepID=UPI00222611B3|nr:thiamine pyrophosphate-dependent dehydrogenase E1 component subunit alpha [Azospirillum canadense]MCW2241366.1 pyruvate dehydrogenase E1 component alpha subunit [Azospirillum canadense]